MTKRSLMSQSHNSLIPVIPMHRIRLLLKRVGFIFIMELLEPRVWIPKRRMCSGHAVTFLGNHWRGAGSSPIIYKNMLYLHFDGYDHQYIVALDKKTGEVIWKKDREIDYKTDNGDSKKAYATPRIIEYEGRVQLISPAAKATLSYNPLTGDMYWKFYYPQHSAACRPLFDGERIFVGTGFGKAYLYAVNPGGNGDVTKSHVKWIEQKGIPSKPSQLFIDGMLFMVDDKGIASCLDAKTGKLIWKERFNRSTFSASPIYADGKIYMSDRTGLTRVIKPAKKYEELAANKLDAGCISSLAVAGKAIILRTPSHLYRIENKQK